MNNELRAMLGLVLNALDRDDVEGLISRLQSALAEGYANPRNKG